MSGKLGAMWWLTGTPGDSDCYARAMEITGGGAVLRTFEDATGSFIGYNIAPNGTAVSADGRYLAMTVGSYLRVVDLTLATTVWVKTLLGTSTPDNTLVHRTLEFSPDGTKIAVTTTYGLEVYGVYAAMPIISAYSAVAPLSLAWHPNGTKICLSSAAASYGNPWYVDIGTNPATLLNILPSLATWIPQGGGCNFNADGTLLAVWAHDDNTSSESHFAIIDLVGNTVLNVPKTFSGTQIVSIWGVDFLPDGSGVLIASSGGFRKIGLTSPYAWLALPIGNEVPYNVACRPVLLNNRYYCITLTTANRRFRVWDLGVSPPVDISNPSDYTLSLGGQSPRSVRWGYFCHEISNADTTAVVDETGTPVAGARVFAYRRQNNELLLGYVVTDANGRFKLYDSRSCEHTVIVAGQKPSEGAVIIPRITHP